VEEIHIAIPGVSALGLLRALAELRGSRKIVSIGQGRYRAAFPSPQIEAAARQSNAAQRHRPTIAPEADGGPLMSDAFTLIKATPADRATVGDRVTALQRTIDQHPESFDSYWRAFRGPTIFPIGRGAQAPLH
jgi:hypothetical protein